MKIFKKALKVLFVILLLAMYCNVGYYYGNSWYTANLKFYSNEQLNNFQKFQLGAWSAWHCNVKDPKDISKDAKYGRYASIVAWPIALILSLLSWLVFGVVQGAIAVWHGVVWFFWIFGWFFGWFFNLIFLGGLFKLLGLYWTLMVINLLVGIFLFRWGTKIEKRFKRFKCESNGKALVLASTMILGLACPLALISDVREFWYVFYGMWTLCLFVSLVFNISKE